MDTSPSKKENKESADSEIKGDGDFDMTGLKGKEQTKKDEVDGSLEAVATRDVVEVIKWFLICQPRPDSVFKVM